MSKAGHWVTVTTPQRLDIIKNHMSFYTCCSSSIKVQRSMNSSLVIQLNPRDERKTAPSMSYLYLCLLKGEHENVNVTALVEIILVRFKVSSWPSIEAASYTFLCRFCQDLSVLTRSACERWSLVLPQITDMGYSSCFDLNPPEACLETTF